MCQKASNSTLNKFTRLSTLQRTSKFYNLQLYRSCKTYQIILLSKIWYYYTSNCVDNNRAKWNFWYVFASQATDYFSTCNIEICFARYCAKQVSIAKPRKRQDFNSLITQILIFLRNRIKISFIYANSILIRQ